ncbi:hypothetical protein [Paraburkholderia sp. J63]|uniref:hypothetical protein n=1 Tax=Paraburkholderia sp. J63 TaxID=2805434 RepID=UPI002ABD5E5D|nr:hypothetical protein [Paraburkholderia sp. J63]
MSERCDCVVRFLGSVALRFLHALICTTIFAGLHSAWACKPFSPVSYYFGYEKLFQSDWEFEVAVDADIKRTKTITFEAMEPIEEHHVFFLRYGMLYVKGRATEFIDGSFRYLGNGYFRLRGKLYYRGVPEADFPVGSTIKTWNYTYSSPLPPGPDGMSIFQVCDFPDFYYVLEASNGLRLVHKERYGGEFITGLTCRNLTGHSCAELRRTGGFRDHDYHKGG